MSYFNEIYLKRLNKYGKSYKERTQGLREKTFSYYADRSVYKVTFEYNENEEIGVLEPNSQDNTEVLQYLLTDRDLKIPNGTFLNFPINGDDITWMVYWSDIIEASGYNRYTLLKMTHKFSWIGRDGNTYETLCYFYGQENNMLKDELKSRSRSHVLYTENLKLSFLVLPLNKNINKDDYFEVNIGDDIIESYRVTGYDRASTPGVEFVSVDPLYKYDLTPAPEPQPGDDEEDYFWFNGGLDNDGN